MRGVLLSGFGEAEQLIYSTSVKLKNCAIPTDVPLLPTQLLVRVKACAISELDVLARQGAFIPFTKANNGVAIGYEMAGVLHFCCCVLFIYFVGCGKEGFAC